MIVAFPGHTHLNFAQLTMFVHVLSYGRSEFLLYSILKDFKTHNLLKR